MPRRTHRCDALLTPGTDVRPYDRRVPSLVARPLRVLAVLVVLELGFAVVGVSPPTASAPSTNTLQARVAPKPEISREQAVRTLLAQRAAAVRSKDRTAFLSTVEPLDSAFRRQQIEFFDALTNVPLQQWDYQLDAHVSQEFSAAVEARRGPGWWAPRVTLSYRISGVDAKAVTSQQRPTFVPRDGRWYLAAEDDVVARSGQDLWDGGPVVAVHRGPVLVLGHPDSKQLLQNVAASAADAVPRVTSVWGPEWSRRIVVLVPSSQDELRRLTSNTGDMTQIAAYATSRSPGVGERIVVNPATFPLLGSVGRRVVLTHETTHVATRSHTKPGTPTWLVEGFADYVGYTGVRLPYRVSAQELRADVRRGRVPTQLPTGADFDGANPNLASVYEQGWLATSLIAERYGRAKLLALYRAVGGGESIEQAFPRLLGTDLASFTAAWQADLRRRLA